MHLEETLQLSIDEKEEIIKALQTQVDKRLTQWAGNSTSKYTIPTLSPFYLTNQKVTSL